jgi:inosine-uridine nucleoside N-ribohydrolase
MWTPAPDDAVAIMLAALHPDLELIACTTVNGNVDVAQATDNTLRVLEYHRAPDIPCTRACTGRSRGRTFRYRALCAT